MPTPPVEFWWALSIGTLVVLSLVIIIITSVMVSHKKIAKKQQEKLAVVQQSERVMRESEKKYRTLVETMEDSVFVVNNEGTVIFVNTHFAQSLGETRDQILGKKMTEIFHGDGGVTLLNRIDNVFYNGRTENIEYQLQTGHGTCWLETSLVPQYNQDGKFTSILGISRDVTERVKMDEQLRELVTTLRSQQETLKTLSSEVIRAQESERKRISRELHDEIGQAMTAISFNLESIKNVHSGEEELKVRILDCQQLVQKTASDIHRFSYELRPALLDDLGLLPAIKAHTRTFKERTGIEVNIHGSQAVELLDNEIKTVLYRVFQEGLNNVAKHAHAQTVTIEISKADGGIILRITDDGKGFKPGEIPTAKPGKGGLGLVGMRERVRLVGGDITMISNPGTGTTLSLRIPYGDA